MARRLDWGFLLFGALYISWVSVLVLPALLALGADCFNAWDLGIYAQALQRISWNDWNPFLSVRQVRIFNDHVDPILFLFAPFSRWVSAPVLAVVVDQLWFVVAAIGLLKFAGPMPGALLSAFLLFSRASTNALSFPAHPTTWAVLPMLGLGWALWKKRSDWVWGWLFVLMLFKEEFAFCWFPAAVWFWRVQRQKVAAGAVFVVGVAFTLLLFVFRSQWWGPVVSYASDSYLRYWLNPVGSLRDAFLNESFWKDAIKIIVPFLPLWWAMRREKIRVELWPLIVLSPLLLMRFLASKISFHHGVALLAALLPTIFPWVLGTSFKLRETITGRAWAVAGVLLLLAQLSFLTSFTVPSLLGTRGHCPLDADRVSEIQTAHGRLKEMRAGAAKIPLYAYGNLAPRLVPVWAELRLLGFSIPQDDPAFFVLREKRVGSPWPLTGDEMDRLREGWADRWSRAVLYEGEWIALEEYTRSE